MNKRDNYKYIWTPIISKNNIKFIIENKNISPYLEINEYEINKSLINNNEKKQFIKVNPYNRFYNIFGEYKDIYLNENKFEEKYIKLKENIEHNSILILRELDYISGKNIIDIYVEKIEEDINRGKEGKYLEKNFKKLEVENKKIICKLICDNIINKKNGSEIFKKGVYKFFPDSVIYINKKERKKIYVYLNYNKSKENFIKIKILQYLFLKIDINVKIYWKNHFGIIDVKEIMKIGDIYAI